MREIGFSFSPLSYRVAGIGFTEEQDGKMTVLVSVSSMQVYEVQGERQRQRMEREWEEARKRRGESPPYPFGPPDDDPDDDDDAWLTEYHDLDETPNVWPQNKRCLQHIIAGLKEALPVRKISIDAPLREDGEEGKG